MDPKGPTKAEMNLLEKAENAIAYGLTQMAKKLKPKRRKTLFRP